VSATPSAKPVRHILALSGGKDSSALAVFMKDKVPDME
jgi:tRNA(Ile)-lysidine synthase TilS/MesJ